MTDDWLTWTEVREIAGERGIGNYPASREALTWCVAKIEELQLILRELADAADAWLDSDAATGSTAALAALDRLNDAIDAADAPESCPTPSCILPADHGDTHMSRDGVSWTHTGP